MVTGSSERDRRVPAEKNRKPGYRRGNLPLRRVTRSVGPWDADARLSSRRRGMHPLQLGQQSAPVIATIPVIGITPEFDRVMIEMRRIPALTINREDERDPTILEWR